MVPASPSDRAKSSNCVFCGSGLLTEGAPASAFGFSLCGQCGAPQPLAAGEDYFSVFGLKRGFAIDREKLDRDFYAVSRELHPDRFGGAVNPSWKEISVARMTFLNQAHLTLRSPEKTREYLMGLEGLKPEGDQKAQIPVDLAEEWFELQDAVMSADEGRNEKIAAFEADLKARAARLKTEIERIEKDYDANPSRGALETIGRKIQDGAYLKSMDRDVKRLRARLGI